jgi:hypothetical protein
MRFDIYIWQKLYLSIKIGKEVYATARGALPQLGLQNSSHDMKESVTPHCIGERAKE